MKKLTKEQEQKTEQANKYLAEFTDFIRDSIADGMADGEPDMADFIEHGLAAFLDMKNETSDECPSCEKSQAKCQCTDEEIMTATKEIE